MRDDSLDGYIIKQWNEETKTLDLLYPKSKEQINQEKLDTNEKTKGILAQLQEQTKEIKNQETKKYTLEEMKELLTFNTKKERFRYPASILLHMEDKDFLEYINRDDCYFEGSQFIIDRVNERYDEIMKHQNKEKQLVTKIKEDVTLEEVLKDIDITKMSRQQLRRANKNKFSNQVKGKLLNKYK